MRAQEFVLERKKKKRASARSGGYFFPGYGYYGSGGDAGEGGGDGGGESINKVTKKMIHDLADRRGIAWDNEPDFLRLTAKLTGHKHLDDLDAAQLRQVYNHIQGQQGVAEEQLDELSFLGSQCTKDCSGHRAGYEWSKRKGLRQANSWSPSFNKGAGLAVAGK